MTRTKPRITIITVVRNGAQHLEETIQSVLALGYGNLAYVIIDGGSTDGTVDMIRKYSDRLACWVSEPDNGIYDAMNKGWKAAAPDSFVLFLGAGDRILSVPENMHEFNGDDVIYGDVQVGERMFRGNAGFGLRCNNTLHHQALLVPKSLHPEPPFDTRFRVYADFDFNQRLLKMGANFVYSPELRAYALPGGLSEKKAHQETLGIVRENFGLAWCAVALCYMAARKVLKAVNDPTIHGPKGEG